MIKFKEKIREEFDNDPLGTLMGIALIGLVFSLAMFLLIVLPIAFVANVLDDPAPQQTQGEWK